MPPRLPKPGGILTLADGKLAKIERVWYTTSPPGTYRVTFKVPGEPLRGCKAWWRKGEWTEWQPNDLATDDDRQHAHDNAQAEDLW